MNRVSINRENYIISKNKLATRIIMTLTYIIGIIYVGVLLLSKNSNQVYNDNMILFVKIFELILAILAIISCIICYNTTKKEELFIISLVYIMFFIDILLGTVDSMTLNTFIANNYITIISSIIRVVILIISISSLDVAKNLILNNKIKSLLFIISVSFTVGIIKTYDFNNLAHFMYYNLFLVIIYITVSIKYLIKSIKNNEYIYSVISSSIFFFAIKALYAVVGSINGSLDIKLISISITYMGFIILISGIVFELLLSMEINKELKNDLAIFKKIVDESKQSSIVVYDEFENIKYLNNKTKEYFDINKELRNEQINKQVKEKLLNEFKEVGDEKIQEIRRHILYDGYWNGIIELTSKDTTLTCSIQKIYMYNKVNVVIMFSDISDKIRVEKELLEYERIKHQEEVRNEFFANMSHELRTPLNIFYSTVQLLDMKNEKNPKEFSKEYIKHKQSLKTNCQRMLRLINNIVDITKIDVGFIKPEFVNCDIIRLVEDITLSVVNYAAPKKINIEFDTDTEEHIIKCDEDMVERIMLNLLSNAIKFTRPNGNIWVNIYVDSEWVHIVLKDDGIGIPIEYQEVIFDRFIQSDKSLTRLNEGSGIGLSIVKSAIELNEGEIYINSDGENGTEFEILLPNKKLEGYNLHNRIYKVDTGNIELELSDIYELYS